VRRAALERPVRPMRRATSHRRSATTTCHCVPVEIASANILSPLSNINRGAAHVAGSVSVVGRVSRPAAEKKKRKR
jgi:hypothetical protein